MESGSPTIAAVFAPVTDVLAPVATVFNAIAHVLAMIAHILTSITNVLATITEAAVVQRVAPVFAAVADVLRPVTTVLQTIAHVLAAITHVLTAVANILAVITARRRAMEVRVSRTNVAGLSILCERHRRRSGEQGRGDRSHSEIAHRIPQRQNNALAVVACAAHSTPTARPALSSVRRLPEGLSSRTEPLGGERRLPHAAAHPRLAVGRNGG